MISSVYYLIVFNSKNHAYFLENTLNKLGHKAELLQVPSYLSRSCSFALKINSEEVVSIALKVIEEKKLDIYKAYKHSYDNEKNKKIYKVIKNDKL